MANTNFTVHNGLTVGPAFVYAGNGDIITSGNISVTGSASFGGLSSNQIYSGSNNVTVSGSTVNVAIASSNIASFSSTGLTLTGAVQANTHTGVAVYAGTIGNTGTTLTGTLSTNAQPYVTSVGTLGSLTITGAVNGNTHTGVAVYAGTIGNTGTTLTGTLSTAAQTNITSVGTLTGLISSANITAQTANVYAAYVVANSGLSGTLITNAQTNITSVGTLGSLTVTGAVQANTHTGVAVYAGTIGNTGTTLTGTLSTAAQTNITSVGTLSSLAASGVITSGGNINVTSATNSTSTTSGSIVTAGGIGVAQDAYIGGKLYVGGNTTFINTTIINTTDTLSAPTIIAGSGGVYPNANASVNLGTTSAYWNNVYAVNFLGTSTTAKYADLAERYTSDADYEAGTVVDFGGDREITISNINGSQYVAGVVSTNPAYMMNSDADGLYIALVGRVPCKVTGRVRKGQMMVSNGDGTARGENNPIMGSVIGKALENFSGGTGVIEVVVGRL